MGYNEEQLGAIADAIRSVTGQTDKIKATEFANIIKTFNGPTFEVKYNLQNLTSDGKSFGVMNKDYIATLTPSQYHEVPETIEVKRNGVVATEGVDYTYKKVYNNITLSISSSNSYGGSVYYSVNGGEEKFLGTMEGYTITNGVERVVLNNVSELVVRLDCGDVPETIIRYSNGEMLYINHVDYDDYIFDVTSHLQDNIEVIADVCG